MGLFEDTAEMIEEAIDKGYVDDAINKYDFTDFGDVTACCDEFERACQMDNMIKGLGYQQAMMVALEQYYSEGKISDSYIVRIYKYCLGMDHPNAGFTILRLMHNLGIEE